MARTPSSSLDKSPLHMLHRAGQRAAELFQKELGENDLTPRQYAVMLTVAQEKGLNQTQIVERTSIDRSTMADLIRRMLKKGLLKRRRTSKDARAYSVELTDFGQQSLNSAEPISRRVDAKILAFLPADQRERLLQELMAMVESLALPAKNDPPRKRKAVRGDADAR
jgi:MarR family transcriptional regulator, temperature-dependent positive regulator of motility